MSAPTKSLVSQLGPLPLPGPLQWCGWRVSGIWERISAPRGRSAVRGGGRVVALGFGFVASSSWRPKRSSLFARNARPYGGSIPAPSRPPDDLDGSVTAPGSFPARGANQCWILRERTRHARGRRGMNGFPRLRCEPAGIRLATAADCDTGGERQQGCFLVPGRAGRGLTNVTRWFRRVSVVEVSPICGGRNGLAVRGSASDGAAKE